MTRILFNSIYLSSTSDLTYLRIYTIFVTFFIAPFSITSSMPTARLSVSLSAQSNYLSAVLVARLAIAAVALSLCALLALLHN
jgi:hypothetical protein